MQTTIVKQSLTEKQIEFFKARAEYLAEIPQRERTLEDFAQYTLLKAFTLQDGALVFCPTLFKTQFEKAFTLPKAQRYQNVSISRGLGLVLALRAAYRSARLHTCFPEQMAQAGTQLESLSKTWIAQLLKGPQA